MKKIILRTFSTIFLIVIFMVLKNIVVFENYVPTSNSQIYLNEKEVNYNNSLGFDMKSYFENLYTNVPYNSNGSCGYVSLISVMSYYDSFFNDNIIPEVYEVNSIADNFETAISNSPGVNNEIYHGSDYEKYCFDSSDYNLQSKLTILHNENNVSFSASIHGVDYENLLEKFYSSKNYFEFEDLTANTQVEYKEFIFKYLDQNIPVILHIYDGENKRHSVVAYDYDDENIYANFGYQKKYSSKLPIYSLGYNEIYYAIVLKPTIAETHSNNYVVNRVNYCGCGKHVIHNIVCDQYDVYTHKCYCAQCNYYYLENHSWIYLLDGKKMCNICKIKVGNIPIIHD